MRIHPVGDEKRNENLADHAPSLHFTLQLTVLRLTASHFFFLLLLWAVNPNFEVVSILDGLA